MIVNMVQWIIFHLIFLTQGMGMIKSLKSSIYDPDTSNYHQTMVSEHREDLNRVHGRENKPIRE